MATHEIETNSGTNPDKPGRKTLLVWIIDGEHEPDHPDYREPRVIEVEDFPEDDTLLFQGKDFS